MFNRAKAMQTKAKNLRQKQKDATEFFSDPKNLKLFQQVRLLSALVRLPCSLSCPGIFCLTICFFSSILPVHQDIHRISASFGELCRFPGHVALARWRHHSSVADCVKFDQDRPPRVSRPGVPLGENIPLSASTLRAHTYSIHRMYNVCVCSTSLDLQLYK